MAGHDFGQAQTETYENRYYILTYGGQDFRDVMESRPDIYVKVLDNIGKTLYTSKRVRSEADRVEIVNVTIR